MFKFINGNEGNHVDSIEKISKLEEKYSIVFPECLKDFYQKFDGEKIKLTTFAVEGYECEVSKIIPIVADKMDFEYIKDNDISDGFVSDDFYPLARDRGGNYYYWEAKTGRVLLVFSDDFDNPFVISSSVKNFFELLDITN